MLHLELQQSDKSCGVLTVVMLHCSDSGALSRVNYKSQPNCRKKKNNYG